jgi:drug/metabolite transporter (DMT)-like permease
MLGSSLLAFGPLLVRVADTGPVASAFWRMALAAPVLVTVALILRHRHASPPTLRSLPWGLALAAGAFFALDIAAWHLGIVRTSTANATLFANTTAFVLLIAFMLYVTFYDIARLGRRHQNSPKSPPEKSLDIDELKFEP